MVLHVHIVIFYRCYETVNNLESLRAYNSYIRETIVFANLLNQDSTESEKNDLIAKIEQLKQESKDFAELSLSSRP